MNTKKIEAVIVPQGTHFVGDGFRVHNFIPGVSGLSMQRMSPFIMLDYNSKFVFPPSEHLKGVGVHPHKGFETVTIAYKGRVAHHDSSGGGGVIGEGDVQWMTAASGILHKEYHEENFNRTGGEFQMVQLWVNLPAKDKTSAPKYQAITNADMTKVDLPDQAGSIEIIAGNYNEHKGPAFTFTPVNLMNAKLNASGKASFSFPANYNTAALVIEGSVKVNGVDAPTDNFILFENNGENFTIEATENAIVLIMSGEPINEPIFAHGPFVMNTREEIIQAFDDFNRGKFGTLQD
ncbi:MAG: pirin family protein [Flavobacteriaceae bacterium]|jgi:redox-sensitive bicupin YhaK (pirin superfamily)|nr:pirin family protein [Flavobacteriaceae bacterium]